MLTPTCLNTRADRIGYNLSIDVMDRYRRIAAGIYEWSGLPDDVPTGYIETCLFDYGCIGAKEVQGLGICILPASVSIPDLYGRPFEWIPTVKHSGKGINLDISKPSTNPALWLGTPPVKRAEIYADILINSLISLRQNVIALRQPIALNGEPGRIADGIMLKSEIENGTQFIPIIDASRVGVEVIDLKARDFTQQLIATANAMDNEILTILGVQNTGTEKSSGITVEETISLHQELKVTSDIGLKERQAWCDKINPVLGTNFWVELSDAYSNSPINMEMVYEQTEEDEVISNE